MTGFPSQQWLERTIGSDKRLWLFLDYDGTLADLAPTPDHVNPEPEVVSLLTRLAGITQIRVAVISGRRLSHLETLVPVPNILLAGTYGVELRTPQGRHESRVDFDSVRPILDLVKTQWMRLISNHESFFLEDKGWALALHGRYVDEERAKDVLGEARELATEGLWQASPDAYRILGGHKFLEIGPSLAHKGKSVDYILQKFQWPDAMPIYMGDDDKDEEAFEVVKSHGGITILVSQNGRQTRADHRLETPMASREFLEMLSAHVDR